MATSTTIAAAAATSTTRRLRAFKRWMRSQSIDCSDALNLIDHAKEGISVRTLCDLHEGDLVATIPKHSCLTIKTSGARNLIETAGLEGYLGLSVALMYEKGLGHQSPWFGYLQLLPENECIPMLWSLEEVDSLLLGTELHKIVKEDKALIYEDWEECIQPLLASAPVELNPDFFGVEQYLAAKSLIASRSFQIDDYYGFGMVPLADLLTVKAQLPSPPLLSLLHHCTTNTFNLTATNNHNPLSFVSHNLLTHCLAQPSPPVCTTLTPTVHNPSNLPFFLITRSLAKLVGILCLRSATVRKEQKIGELWLGFEGEGEVAGEGWVVVAEAGFNHKTGAEDVHFTSISSHLAREDDAEDDHESDEYESMDDSEDNHERDENENIGDREQLSQNSQSRKGASNGGNSECSSASGDDPTVLEMIIVKDVKNGAEVFNTYGVLGNAALLHRYGFTEVDNTYDIVNIDLELVLQWSSSLFSGRHNRVRFSLWRRLDYSGCESQNSEYFEISSNGEPQVELLILLYIILLPDEAYQQLDLTVSMAGNLKESLTVILQKGGNIAMEKAPEMSKDLLLIESVSNALLSLANIRESFYGSNSLKDDIEALKKCCRIKDRKLYHSLTLRVSERTILEKLRTYAAEAAQLSRTVKRGSMRKNLSFCDGVLCIHVRVSSFLFSKWLVMDTHVMLVCCYGNTNAVVNLQAPFRYHDLVNHVYGNFLGLTAENVCLFFKIPYYNNFTLKNDVDIENMVSLVRSFPLQCVDVIIQLQDVEDANNIDSPPHNSQTVPCQTYGPFDEMDVNDEQDLLAKFCPHVSASWANEI
ncbi:hypothetical protein TEA_027733 [Camellia sinensis var. sinensis]|uniref:SET domain-containing protein n=1 Tax=Camellia sinensis var. sinensis TaxID=542762 RepID=A0A4S4EZF3_CAMSN|nr:hypothetical protein TEA_027733 [Camellia sinensis var. sinensis]